MTEEEAKTKWCPQTTQRPSKRVPHIEGCIGSKCMAWRWHEDYTGGYCGLAGHEENT